MEQYNLPYPEPTDEDFLEQLGSESGPRGEELAEGYDDRLAGGRPIGPLTGPNTTAPDDFGEYQPGYAHRAGGTAFLPAEDLLSAEDLHSKEGLPKEEC